MPVYTCIDIYFRFYADVAVNKTGATLGSYAVCRLHTIIDILHFTA